MKRRRLRPHQVEALNYAAPRSGIALFKEMRLGKSLVFIRWAIKKMAERFGSVLIITPATTAHVWVEELWMEGIEAAVLAGSTKAKSNTLHAAKAGGVRWFIVNPEGVRVWPGLASEGPWCVVGLDETGGWFTNPQAKVVKVIRKQFGSVANRAILTGLPDPGGPEDYFEQMAFAFRAFMGFTNYWQWRMKFMEPAFFGWELKRNSRRKIKRAVKKLAFIKTAKQAGVFVPKVYESRIVEPPAPVRKLLKEVKRDFTCGDSETKWVVVAQSWLSMLAGGIVPDSAQQYTFKADELCRLATGELKGKKIVVWARFIREIKMIQDRLKRAGLKVGRLTGLTRREMRPRVLDNFRRGDLDVVVIQEAIGQFALNLAFADVMVFYSNTWDWGQRGQCEKRLDHMDKAEPVLVIDLISRGTIDEALVEVLKEKKQSTKYFLQKVMVKARKKGVAGWPA